jgi:6-phosphogluconolactonase
MIKAYSDKEALAHGAARMLVEQFEIVMTQSKRFSLVLSGGATPNRTYEVLCEDPYRKQIDWSKVHVFWGDERCVPSTDSMSNYGLAKRILLAKVPIPNQQIHPILNTLKPHSAAADYEATLRSYFGNSAAQFDFVFLGLGKDGHTASLFPNSSALNESSRWVTHLQNPTEDFARITLTPQIINQAKKVVFLVIGNDKADILKKVLQDTEPQNLLPARLIRPVNGKLVWLSAPQKPTQNVIERNG